MISKKIQPYLWFLLCFSSPLFSSSSCQKQNVSLSVYATSLPTGKPVYEKEADKCLNPLSCLKIVTTATAFALLGEEKTFITALEYDGFLTKEGILEGNLYLRGGGDPTLGSNRIASCLNWQELLVFWKELIKAKGIKVIRGNLIPDTSYWKNDGYSSGWLVEDVGNYYGSCPSVLAFHENSYTLVFSPHSHIGKPATLIKTDPPITHIAIKNEVLTGPAGSGDQAFVFGGEGSQMQVIRGTIPALVKEFSIKGAILDSPRFCTGLFEKTLVKEGIHIEKKTLPFSSKRTLLYETISPPLKEIIHITNQKSHNLYAEHLLRAIGKIDNGNGSAKQGIATIEQFWEKQGVNLTGLFLDDASGVSMKNQMSSKQLVEILQRVFRSSYFSSFLSSLPEKNKNLFAKTGSSSQGRGLAGYYMDAKSPIAFAIFLNHCLDPILAKEIIEEELSHIISAANAANSERSVLSKER